jgi:syntaxin 5
MPVQDRTNEFRACVESIRTRSSLPSTLRRKTEITPITWKSGGKSDFSRMAAGIGKDISSTNLKLGKLAQRSLTI